MLTTTYSYFQSDRVAAGLSRLTKVNIMDFQSRYFTDWMTLLLPTNSIKAL